MTFKQILSDIQIFQAGSIFTLRLIKTFVPPWFISKQWCCNKTTYANGFNCVKHSSRLSTKKPLSIYLTGWQDIAFSPPHRVLPLDAWIHLVIHRGEYLGLFLQWNLRIFGNVFSRSEQIDLIATHRRIYFVDKLRIILLRIISSWSIDRIWKTSFYITENWKLFEGLIGEPQSFHLAKRRKRLRR